MGSKIGGSFFSVFLALVVGAFLGAAGTYVMLQEDPAARTPGGAPAAPAGPEAPDDAISRKLREWNLDPENLRRELDRAGRIIREKGREIGGRVAHETQDVRIIAVIKAKYTLDDQLSAWDISVGSHDGHVTLTGTVDSPEQIGRAIVFALDTDGVVDVDSSLRVRPAGAPPG